METSDVEPLGEHGDVILLCRAPSIREEDEGNVALLEQLQGLGGSRECLFRTDEDPVDIEGEGNRGVSDGRSSGAFGRDG
jgi:hypothetical protein